MTRERMRTAYFESINRKCDICDGSGIVMTEEMVAITALREIHTRASKGGLRGITCKLPVESMNYLINTKRDEISQIEKEDKISIRLTADPKLFPGQYSITVEKTGEEKPAAKEEKKAEYRAPHPVKHKAEHRVEHKIEHKTEAGQEQKEQMSEQKPESEKRPKRSRSRGRRRSRHGQKTPSTAATAGAPAAEALQTEVGTGGAAAISFPAQDVVTPGRSPEEEARISDEKRTGPEAGHTVDHQADHTSEFRPEAGIRPKRSRPWGRRRPKHGPKTGAQAETSGADAEEATKAVTESQNEELSGD
jgi:hypothetical protein